MANPAPTINQINAFNATQGTTIDFNIIGGTELVRSNRIYIYDLSDNSLICTHLYVSTESIHELPPNTDGSIVYEDGKSSADFVNGAQYYAQIQTFTDIAGTEGGSGLSVAKMFWCLVDPTLTITTIPSTISTTSYNVSATYNANTSVVSNIIQQYQFSLYSATGSLLQSSGVVVGSGTQQGTSTAYDISYNFTGLSVGSSYYVVVDVTTTQGMSVSAQSNTFTVSIDTPTLGEATVVNNACDGYISVTSNLSSEYGGSGSGEIVSFETDSENVFTKLQVDLDPIQDLNGYDAPWVGGAGKNLMPYPNARDVTFSGVRFISDGKGTVTMTGTCTGTDYATIIVPEFTIPDGSSYKVAFLNTQAVSNIAFLYNFSVVDTWSLNVVNKTSTYVGMSNKQCNGIRLNIQSGQTYNQKISIMFVLQSTDASSYIPYENICPISGHTEVGVSVTDEQKYNFSNVVIGKNWIGGTDATRATLTFDVEPNTRYMVITEGGNFNNILFIRMENFTQIVNVNINPPFNGYITTESNCNKVIVQFQKGTAITASDFDDFKCSISKEYESYTTQLGQTVYGGTLDVVSGVLTVTHGYVTFDGSSDEQWSITTYGTTNHRAAINYSGLATDVPDSQIADIISNQYETISYNNGNVKSGISARYNNSQINVFGATFTTKTEFTDYLSANPLTVVYKLATPLTYQLTPTQVQTLLGQNNVWSDAGEVEVAYNIPITNLLVKRQDVADVSGDWLTLHSQPITQASDMDFTFIDFTNQYGKTYKYALVPLLTQTQSGVEVEVEGGYTVSDEVQSVFDGVFIVDSTGSQKCKANVGYGNVDMNQAVGTITPIGAKYPVVITNSKNQYHNGSIYGTIVPDDYYFNGNLSRIDMVNKRDELEQFLTNKRAKIIKDWNGKIWLVMIMDNVSCTFNNNYGMGIVNFNTNWVEVGDPTNQQDLQATGLINVGGV